MNRVLLETNLTGGRTLQMVQGDLTQESVDAIVNAANSQLQHGGGVAGAIVRRGGPQIQAESEAWVREHGPVSHAKPAITRSGSLPCRYIIHAVGPVWGEGDEDAKLSAAIHGALAAADRLKIGNHRDACHLDRDLRLSKRAGRTHHPRNHPGLFQADELPPDSKPCA